MTNTSLPGLSVHWRKSGSSLYATVVHVASGTAVVRFTNAPLPFGKREFVKRLDASDLGLVDWTRPADEIVKTVNYNLILDTRNAILA